MQRWLSLPNTFSWLGVPTVPTLEVDHLNEAALISGRNPELEALEAAQKRGRNPEKPGVHDPVLQRALDLVTSIGIFQKR